MAATQTSGLSVLGWGHWKHFPEVTFDFILFFFIETGAGVGTRLVLLSLCVVVSGVVSFNRGEILLTCCLKSTSIEGSFSLVLPFLKGGIGREIITRSLHAVIKG